MEQMFDSDGKLHIPILAKLNKADSKADAGGAGFIVRQAFCPEGHSLMCNIRINGHRGIKLLLTDSENKRESEVVVSPVVGKHEIITLSGEVFKEGEITKIYCPICRTELEILVDCECGAHMYVFYLDSHLDRNFGISFCARVGCTKSSKLRFSEDALMDYLRDHIL